MGRYDWNRMARKRRYKWSRYDRDDDDHRDDGDDDSDGRGGSLGLGREVDDLMKRTGLAPMAGSLLFWAAIWMFAGMEPGLLPIFGGIAIMMGLGWEESEKKKKRRRQQQVGEVLGGEQTKIEGEKTPQATPQPAAPVDASIPARLIRESADARAALTAAASAADGALGANLVRMDVAVARVVEGLQKDNSHLSTVQRLFTYYLPSSVELLKSRRAVVATGNATHTAEIDGMFARLADAFEDFVGRINGTDVRAIEIDLKLLEQSLDAEFDTTKRR